MNSNVPPFAQVAGQIIDAGMGLARRRAIRIRPSGDEFRSLAAEIRTFAKAVDKVINELVGDAADKTAINLPGCDDLLMAALESEDVLGLLERAADQADENNEPERSIFTGRVVPDRVF